MTVHDRVKLVVKWLIGTGVAKKSREHRKAVRIF